MPNVPKLSWFRFPLRKRDRDFIERCDTCKDNTIFYDETKPDPQADPVSWIYGPVFDHYITREVKPLSYGDYIVLGIKKPRKALTSVRRKRILDRKGRVCDVCNHKWNLELHHIDGNAGNNDPDNLRLLCDVHHKQLHSKEGIRYEFL